jgi:hypothetical protein
MPDPALPAGDIRLERSGFSVAGGDGHAVKVAWDQVLEVRAFRMDLIARDLLCLAIGLGTGPVPVRSIQIHEDMPGWYRLLDELPAHLPGFVRGWWSEVSVQAFSPNERLLFRRPASEASSRSDRPSSSERSDL